MATDAQPKSGAKTGAELLSGESTSKSQIKYIHAIANLRCDLPPAASASLPRAKIEDRGWNK